MPIHMHGVQLKKIKCPDIVQLFNFFVTTVYILILSFGVLLFVGRNVPVDVVIRRYLGSNQLHELCSMVICWGIH